MAARTVGPPLHVLIGEGRGVDSIVSVVDNSKEVIDKCIY